MQVLTPSTEAWVPVDLLVVTHNHGDYAPRAVLSLLAQTYQHFDLWILDDGSADHTTSAIERLLKAQHLQSPVGLHLLHHDEPTERAVSRNELINHSSHPLIAWADGDDVSHPTRLSRIVDLFHRHPQVDLVSGGIRIIDADGRVFRGNNVLHSLNPIECRRWLLLGLLTLSFPTSGIRRRVYEETTPWYRDEFIPAEDTEFFLRATRHHQAISFPEIWIDHRLHAQSSSIHATQTAAGTFVDDRQQQRKREATQAELDWVLREGRLATYAPPMTRDERVALEDVRERFDTMDAVDDSLGSAKFLADVP